MFLWLGAGVSGWYRFFAGAGPARAGAARAPDPGRGYLEPDREFEFKLDGLRLSAQVTEFMTGQRLAWSGQGIDIIAYQAWVISGDLGRSRVLAGFSARGAAAIAMREPDPRAAQQTLDRWAADLKAAAESVPR